MWLKVKHKWTDKMSHYRKNTLSCYSASRGIGSGGASAPPKVLICRKSEQNR